jgi:hypothetical protein
LTIATMKKRALLLLADPLLATSAYNLGASYLWSGRLSSRVPLISIGSQTAYLPQITFDLAPYGTEWGIRNSILRRGRRWVVSVRFGQTGTRTTWGIRAATSNAIRLRRLRAGPSVDVWRQPSIDDLPSSTTLTTGAEALVHATIPVWPIGGNRHLSVVMAAGYKGAGFVRGEPLHRGAIFRVGGALDIGRP